MSVERFLGMVVMALAIEVFCWIFVMYSKQMRIIWRTESVHTCTGGQESELHLLLDTEASEAKRRVSGDPIYRMVEKAIEERRHQHGGILGDVGCGSATLWKYVSRLFSHYAGIDAVQYDRFPAGATFRWANLNTERVELPNCIGDTVAADYRPPGKTTSSGARAG